MRRGNKVLILIAAFLIITGVASAETVYRFDSFGQRTLSEAETDSLLAPAGIAIDPKGTVWIADTANHVIRSLEPDGSFRIVAGVPGVQGHRDGLRTDARFSFPHGLEFDLAGNVYIADSGNGVIRRLRPDGIVETWAGVPELGETVDGPRLEAGFLTPAGLAWDLTGHLWVTDYSAHVIRRIDPDGEVTTVAGSPGNPGYNDGRDDIARFHNPFGIDVDAQGRAWVADYGNGMIRSITLDGFVDTIAGTLGSQSHRDGTLEEASFDHPADLVIDSEGNVFVTDSWSHTIRLIADDEVTTVAGLANHAGFRDGQGPAARFNYPFAIDLRSDGILWVADMRNDSIRSGRESDFRDDRRRAVRR
ncbi:MAG: hypothetical protein R3338_08015 [Thermoanaerobaculia bacterium]|nr:hypothetical protein [Thermoanaerobaculia bacterium]